MNISVLNASKTDVKDKFLKEKNMLRDMIFSEIESIEKYGINNTNNCSIEMLKDTIFVIDVGFDDMISNLNEFNKKEKEEKLIQFKESLRYVLYGQ